jgi:hypothetical protein
MRLEEAILFAQEMGTFFHLPPEIVSIQFLNDDTT